MTDIPEDDPPIQIYWAVTEADRSTFGSCFGGNPMELSRALIDSTGAVWWGGCGTYPLSTLDRICLNQALAWYTASVFGSGVVAEGNLTAFPAGSPLPSYEDFMASIDLTFNDLPEHYL